MADASGLVLHRAFEHSREVFVHTNADTVGQAVGLLVHKLSADAIAARGKFTVALSGGSLPKILNKGLAAIKDGVDFSNWHVFFADERCVPLEHDDSNFKACKEALFDHVRCIVVVCIRRRETEWALSV
jgi:6-phosphogluconolactonase